LIAIRTSYSRVALAQHPDIRAQDVVVGIMDSGLDWRHADFQRPDNSARVEMLLHAVHDTNTGTDTFAEFSAADIDAALNGAGNVPAGELTGVVWIDVPTRPSLSCQCLYNEGRQGGANDPKHDACCRDMLCF
jgi:hypothetical protein